MLYEDVTTAAIVVGHELVLAETEVPLSLAQEVRDGLKALNEKYDQQLSLFVAGDTTETGVGVAGALIVGKKVVTSPCYDKPVEFDASKVMEEVEAFPDVPEDYWYDLGDEIGVESAVKDTEPQPILLSWGPLCYGSVHVGERSHDSESTNATYRYVSNQDMYQQWHLEGVDGELIEFTHPRGYETSMSVEFTEALPLDFSDEAVEGYKQEVSELDDPAFFLVCRYD